MKNVILIYFILTSFLATAQIGKSIFEVKLDTTFSSDGFESLNEIIKDKKLVFTGENHQFVHSNQLTKLKLMMYLYEKGFRYFTIELGYGVGYLANQFVSTGDEKAMEILSIGSESKNPMIGFLETVQRFNSDKNEKDKINIVGVDYTRYPLYSIRALLYILDLHNVQTNFPIFYEDLKVLSSARDDLDNLGFNPRGKNIDEDFDLRKSFKTYRSRLFELSIRKIIQDFYTDSVLLKEALGVDFYEFSNILEEMENTLNWYKGDGISVQTHLQRERHLEDRIIAILEKDTTAKISGQFGRCHIRNKGYQQDCFAFDQLSMVERLEEREELKGKILSIPIFYEEVWDFRVKRSKLPLEKARIYLANTENIEAIKFKYDSITGFVLLNTFSRQDQLSQILSEDKDQLIGKLYNRYRENFTEDHVDIFAQIVPFNTSVNDDFGVALMPQNHQFFGVAFRTISEKSWNSIFRISGINPNRFDLDSMSVRYSNWRYDFGFGYNIIHTRRFSFYSDFYFMLGFAKIREQRDATQSQSIYPNFQEKYVYRNFYAGGMGTLGARLKLGFFSLFIEGAYQHDLTNQQWRSNNVILPTSSPVNFSAFSIFGGISFYSSDRIKDRTSFQE